MITAVVLAAGLSRRMGQPKMLLKWGTKNVIEQVVDTLSESGILDVIVVTGALHDEISSRLKDKNVQVVFNPSYANGEMIDSLQTGLSHVQVNDTDVMVVLGDQPFLNIQTLWSLINASEKTGKQIVMPSIQNKRGHPWIIKERVWKDIRNITKPATLRDFIRQYEADIDYVLVEDVGIIRDMDTPDDYERLKPKEEGE